MKNVPAGGCGDKRVLLMFRLCETIKLLIIFSHNMFKTADMETAAFLSRKVFKFPDPHAMEIPFSGGIGPVSYTHLIFKARGKIQGAV